MNANTLLDRTTDTPCADRAEKIGPMLFRAGVTFAVLAALVASAARAVV